ncbi:uncharacterized protein [Oscarella lobularis]|uniref:uncharacterized protein isoform X2 n=1 Tax=Oscarella lobularis TaxID=121494 RepID=UPI0033136CBB
MTTTTRMLRFVFTRRFLSSAPVALSPTEFRRFALESVEKINHNSFVYKFRLPTRDHVLGLNVASALVVRAPIGANGEDVIRPYTPITLNDAKGHFELLVKAYSQGVVSRFMADLAPGDSLEFRGPIPKLQIAPNMKKRIGMIAGGTGLTPMLQVAQELLRIPDDHTELTLLFGNISEDDILLRERLDSLARNSNSRLRVHYVLEKPPDGWKGDVGRISTHVIRRRMPEPSDENLILVCGPPAMMTAICGTKTDPDILGVLKELDYTMDMVYRF